MASPTPSSDGGYGEPTPSKQKKKRAPPSEPRKLVRWNPDTDQLLLLGIDAVCARMGIALPWDEIGKEVEEFVTGEGVKQHIGKVRLARTKVGRKVPEKPEKKVRRKSHAKEIKAEEADEVEPGSEMKLMSLLYHGKEVQPKTKTSSRTPKKPKIAAATTPSRGSSRPTTGRKMTRSTLDREAILGSSNTGSPAMKKPTGKRGRKTKAEQLEEEEEEFEDVTPTKAQRQYGLRVITNEPKYDVDKYDSDEEVELADQDQGDEYVDDVDGEYEAKDDKMEDVKVPTPHKSETTSDMPPPPTINYNQPYTNTGDVNPSQYQSKMQQQYHSNSSSLIQPNPMYMANYRGPNFSYSGYGNAANVPPTQDPFGMDTTSSGDPAMDWWRESMMTMPQPDESAMRSSLNATPHVAQEEDAADKTEKRPTKARKDSKQQEVETPDNKKRSTKAGQATTPASQAKSPLQAVPGSPFDSIIQDQKAVDTNNATFDDSDMTNYPYSMHARNMDYYTGPGVGDQGVNYTNVANDTGMRVQTDYPAALSGMDVVISPHMYSPDAFRNFPAAPANSPVNGNYTRAISGLPSYHNAGISNPLFSANSNAMVNPAHSGSFDSTATLTSIHGSQTDEANQQFNFDFGNDDQTQSGQVDFNHPMFYNTSYNSMPDNHHDDFFGGTEY